jgi:hypothetical protein
MALQRKIQGEKQKLLGLSTKHQTA